MAKTKSDNDNEMSKLVEFLQSRREILLTRWRNVCEEDPVLSSKSSFTREEFNDQIPVLLNVLHQRLNHEPVLSDPVTIANEHGLHRWQSGYPLSDLVIEMEHLFSVLLEEIQLFNETVDGLHPDAFSRVYREVFRLYSESTRGSVSYYQELRQATAAEQAASLQNALNQLLELGKQRSEHLRHSSHDLRSSFSILMMASQLLEMPGTENEREQLMNMLNKNLSFIREMLMQLTDFTRIEAGQESLDIKKFDVASLISKTVESARPLAENRKLFLQAEGTKGFEVSSDPVKVQRILQNLIHNALKYTEEGGIYITWAQENETRWIMSVQDTGPGFSANSRTALLAEHLKPIVINSASHQEAQMVQPPPNSNPVEKVQESNMKESEGLGLYIVKKICELMKATMDIESAPGKGTLVRIKFLMRQEPSTVM
ncbi:sensor histidine kinase [Dyadobacter sediminis]|uniref:histidine kinase n=1 Tax=Dyadobacter sediminis TaxID=1493691 RepID=A0A5R9KK66_9BACT|nr:HAMP domain-containing sensor histidine kinase [Dyadobacter sediminis]TLU96617.1 HAMP domain-containing histidine kinase [Dyadobacter sediminis]GGB83763.1 hypothetical protein GCM10011325_09160 [Dyadobacter sediminis]